MCECEVKLFTWDVGYIRLTVLNAWGAFVQQDNQVGYRFSNVEEIYLTNK